MPAALLERTAELRPYFEQSLAYAQGLKPKPTSRKTTKSAAKKRPARKGKASRA